jgi:hypothetical protein
MVAVAKRIPAKRNGGRDSRPILITSQVEPQMKQSAPKTIPGDRDRIVQHLTAQALFDYKLGAFFSSLDS